MPHIPRSKSSKTKPTHRDGTNHVLYTNPYMTGLLLSQRSWFLSAYGRLDTDRSFTSNRELSRQHGARPLCRVVPPWTVLAARSGYSMGWYWYLTRTASACCLLRFREALVLPVLLMESTTPNLLSSICLPTSWVLSLIPTMQPDGRDLRHTQGASSSLSREVMPGFPDACE